MIDYQWLSSLKPYENADKKKSLFQFFISFLSYFCLLTAMFFLVFKNYPYWIILILALPAAGFHAKLFIIFHDCCHNSFFSSPRACAIIGNICGILTFTPFFDWQRSHGIHHASVSNLDKRGTGDVWLMTVEEYKSSKRLEKIKYRIFRNPIFLFGIAPLFLFLVLYRLPHKNMRRKDLISILFTNLMIASIIVTASLTLGFTVYFKVMFPVVVLASVFGMWLFYIQHQFKKVYWAHADNWDKVKAALQGSSFYKLPALLRFFSGSIGYHHIHHLNPRIPNYKLRKCYNEIPEVREITPITLFASFKSLFLYLWDEKTGELVNYKFLKRV